MTTATNTFINTRVRLQRLLDMRFFAGWMQDFDNSLARITIRGRPSLEIGENFIVECHGREKIAMFQAQVSGVTGEDIILVLVGPITYRPTVENARVVVHGVTGMASHDGLAIDVEVIDVSENGVGMVSGQSLPRGERIQLALNTPCGDIHCAGEVRYSKPDNEQFGKFRVGVALEPLDRLAGARWKRLYDSAG